jgi:hypothetical protein
MHLPKYRFIEEIVGDLQLRLGVAFAICTIVANKAQNRHMLATVLPRRLRSGGEGGSVCFLSSCRSWLHRDFREAKF